MLRATQCFFLYHTHSHTPKHRRQHGVQCLAPDTRTGGPVSQESIRWPSNRQTAAPPPELQPSLPSIQSKLTWQIFGKYFAWLNVAIPNTSTGMAEQSLMNVNGKGLNTIAFTNTWCHYCKGMECDGIMRQELVCITACNYLINISLMCPELSQYVTPCCQSAV